MRGSFAAELRNACPDLIFTSETEAGGGVPRAEVRRAVAGLRPRPSVYALEPHSLGDILSDVKTVGDATGCQGPARALIEALRARIDAVTLRSALALERQASRRIVCLVSNDPPIAAGWWLAELIGLAGGLDALDGISRPPRAVTRAEIEAARPDRVVDLTPPTPLSGAERGEPDCLLPSPRRRGAGGEVFPGPGAVSLLERLVALIVPAGAEAIRRA